MKPLTFSRPMVLARRAGRKTQTRRLVRGQLPHSEFRIPNSSECPYGRPGEHLWVREDFQVLPKEDHPHVIETADGVFVRYLADGQVTLVELDPHERGRWLARKFPYRKTPARFMYQSLARDKPTLVSIRVERLQGITEEDAIAEGIVPVPGTKAGQTLFDCQAVGQRDGMPNCLLHDTARLAFRHLWESLHGPESWTANPWVWVLELTPFKA